MIYKNINDVIYGVGSNSVTVIKCKNRNLSLSIPKKVNGLPAKKIKKNAFRKCKLQSVIIPGSVTRMGSKAFADCKSLISIVLSNSIKKISERLFEGCTDLVSIVIPDSVTKIGAGALAKCKKLESVKILGNVVVIEKYAFDGCESLTSINIPNSVREIDKCVFRGCISLTEISIPTTTKVDRNAFPNRLDKIVVPVVSKGTIIPPSPKSPFRYTKDKNNNCVIIDKYVGKNTSIIIPAMIENLPVTEIGDSAFKDCKSLKEVEIPNSVIKIGDRAFENCTNLEKVNIPDTVAEIGDNTFENCTSLQNIYIQNSVKEIGECAFENCTLLNSIDIPESVTKIKIGTDAFKNRPARSTIIKLKSETSKKYSGVKIIKSQYNAFNSIIIPAKIDDKPVEEIEEEAF